MSLTAAATVALIQSTSAGGQCAIAPSEKLVALGGEPGDRFGHSVALDGDVLVVGAYRDDDMCAPGTSCNSGSVHVYRRANNQWLHEAELHADDLASGDNFGRAVALSGNTLLVGSPLDDDHGSGSGSAYVFTFSGGAWTQQAKLTASDAASGDTFGGALAIEGDTAVVGSVRNDHAGGSNAGAAYVYTRTGGTWSQTAKLTAADAEANANFGNAVDLSLDTIIVGAENDDDPVVGRNAGAAYMFTLLGGSWTQTAKVTASLTEMDARFGWAVKVLGETAVITALEEDDHGAVYVFLRGAANSWNLHQRLESDDVATFDDFGHSLALGETTLVIGAVYDDDACGGSPACDSGSAYIFEMAGGAWTQTTKLTAIDASADDEFGYSVAMNDDTIVVGARRNEQLGDDAGAVYAFTADCPVNTCPGDLDQDGLVGIGDLIVVLLAWAEGPESGADLNGDGVVNVFDLIEVLMRWGPCPAETATLSEPAPLSDEPKRKRRRRARAGT